MYIQRLWETSKVEMQQMQVRLPLRPGMSEEGLEEAQAYLQRAWDALDTAGIIGVTVGQPTTLRAVMEAARNARNGAGSA
jgi:hypothetical protein